MWNHVAVAVGLAGALAIVSAAAVAAGQACQNPPERTRNGQPQTVADPGIPRVRIERQRCPASAPVHKDKDKGCDTEAQARVSNPPPPEGTEPAFGEVPVAVVVPPSAPYSGQVPPGPAPSRERVKPGCGTHPAS